MWKYKYVVYSIIIKDSICKMLSEFWGKTLQNHLQLSEICLERIVQMLCQRHLPIENAKGTKYKRISKSWAQCTYATSSGENGALHPTPISLRGHPCLTHKQFVSQLDLYAIEKYVIDSIIVQIAGRKRPETELILDSDDARFGFKSTTLLFFDRSVSKEILTCSTSLTCSGPPSTCGDLYCIFQPGVWLYFVCITKVKNCKI